VFVHRDSREGDVGDPRVTHVAFTDVELDLAEGGPGRDTALGRLEEALGVPLVRMHQVHGREVIEVLDAQQSMPGADGLVTALSGVGLLVRVADCVPILLADLDRGLVGAVHAGRNGLASGIVPAAVSRMRDLGAGRLTGWIGPHICGACYEVPPALRAEVAELVPESYAETSWGTPALDIGAGVTAQLQAAECEIIQVGPCTLEHLTLHSHRRDGTSSGRLGAVIWTQP
jgi:polyphenol oxidase